MGLSDSNGRFLDLGILMLRGAVTCLRLGEAWEPASRVEKLADEVAIWKTKWIAGSSTTTSDPSVPSV